MTWATWATLLGTFTVAIVVPGPDTFLLLRLGLRARRAAVLAACGIMIGNTIWTTASVLGLAALMRALPGALPALQVLGAAVLIWMGTQSIRAGIEGLRNARRTSGQRDGATPDGEALLRGTSTPTAHPLRLGLVTNLSNPKALLFFAALFSQILPPDASWVDRTAIVAALTVLGVAWFVSFALLTSSRPFQRWFGSITPLIDIVAGAVFVLVAAVILVELALAALPAVTASGPTG